jgi:tetratricopeptide (TPR) repeat protein
MRFGARLGLTRYEADEYYREALDAYQKNNLEEALTNITFAIELVPNHSEYYATRGFFHLEHGLKDKAQEDFEEALRRHSYEMLAHYGRGIIAYKDKNWEEAQAHFNDAWAAMPDRAETLYYMALTNHRLRQHKLALYWMEQAQAKFEAQEDKRSRDAEKWVREFKKIVEREEAVINALPE